VIFENGEYLTKYKKKSFPAMQCDIFGVVSVERVGIFLR
jgi:hypothetical protein